MAQQGEGHEGPSSNSRCNVAGPDGPAPMATLPMSMPERPEAIIDDNVSLSGELECPICYQIYCDPIRAGCERHVFCRNCLLRAQRGSPTTRCPVCRCESRADVCTLPVATDILEKVRAKDPEYSEHLAMALKEREDYLKQLASSAMQLPPRALWQSAHYFDGWSTLRGIPIREVRNAGTIEVNGIYVAGTLPTYVGPPLYHKLNSSLFIFRWRQTRWVIAELASSRSMGDAREWLYEAASSWPEEVPPLQGWEVIPESRARSPAPEIHIYDSSVPSMSDPEATTLPESVETSPSRTQAVTQVRSRCTGVTHVRCCSIM